MNINKIAVLAGDMEDAIKQAIVLIPHCPSLNMRAYLANLTG